MTDPQTMEEIKAAMADKIYFSDPKQDPQKFDGAGVAVEGAPEPQQITSLPPKPKGLHQLFTRDELIPLKGVWFKAVEVEEEKLVLVPTHFTKNFTKRNK